MINHEPPTPHPEGKAEPIGTLFFRRHTESFSVSVHHAVVHVGQYLLTITSKEMTKTDTNKENEPIDLEEFGSYAPITPYPCTDVHKSSPNKDSPSRRKRLMGSLRRIGSLRNIHSPPSKTKDLRGPLAEPEVKTIYIASLDLISPIVQSPCTPVRGMRQSLALNFEESPPGRPMFEIISRSRSDS